MTRAVRTLVVELRGDGVHVVLQVRRHHIVTHTPAQRRIRSLMQSYSMDI